MSVAVLNMKFIITDIQFAPLNSILLFILNILPGEYPASRISPSPRSCILGSSTHSGDQRKPLPQYTLYIAIYENVW